MQTGTAVREPQVATTSTGRWSQKKELFVQRYLEMGDGAKAARAAGYSQRAAKSVAWRLLHEDPLVKAAVEEGRQALQERNEITLDQMIERLDEDHAFAIETGNANAAVRASELKAKLAGLLVDRVDARTIGALKIELVTFDGAHSAA